MRIMKSIAASVALTVGAVSFAGTAEAGHRRHHIVRHHHYHHNNGGNFAAGAIGFGVGALFGSALAGPRYYEPAPVYVAPAPVVVYEAWTPGWYTYCGQRYRSFNRHTGYYTGYDGGYHFCR